tara:strand:- start:56 stop:283 length:228 start_codon:yes stop_codon:yes gene_type:complete
MKIEENKKELLVEVKQKLDTILAKIDLLNAEIKEKRDKAIKEIKDLEGQVQVLVEPMLKLKGQFELLESMQDTKE